LLLDHRSAADGRVPGRRLLGRLRAAGVGGASVRLDAREDGVAAGVYDRGPALGGDADPPGPLPPRPLWPLLGRRVPDRGAPPRVSGLGPGEGFGAAHASVEAARRVAAGGALRAGRGAAGLRGPAVRGAGGHALDLALAAHPAHGSRDRSILVR